MSHSLMLDNTSTCLYRASVTANLDEIQKYIKKKKNHINVYIRPKSSYSAIINHNIIIIDSAKRNKKLYFDESEHLIMIFYEMCNHNVIEFFY